MEKKHFMVVDDDEDDRTFFCKTLGQISSEVVCQPFMNGRDALNYLEEATNILPEVIFLDINMPVMNGWEFLTKIRRFERTRLLPVIMLSTSSHRRDINIAYDLGATSYCVKPEDPDALFKMLEMVLHNIDKSLEKFLSSKTASPYFYSATA